MSGDPLLPVEDAIRAVLSEAGEPRRTEAPLATARGRILAADVTMDHDVPPFDKSMMDGYALVASDLADLPKDLDVTEVVPAGAIPTGTVGPGRAAKIMTGAPMPPGADAVVMVERTEERPGGRVRIRDSAHPGKNVSPRGENVRAGEVVLRAGRRIGPEEIAVLATAGRDPVPVNAAPTVAVLTTGDELVPSASDPGPGQIRNSNSPLLLALAARDGAAASDLGIVPDDLDRTRAAVREAIGRHDFVVLTGGVSMGDRDLVARALEEEGFRKVFHRIRLKPGKPVLFGTARGSLVFGLPGNPVSVAATYELLVRPAIRRRLGARPVRRPRVRAVLESATLRAIPREQYLPARLVFDGVFRVRALPWRGSADLFGAAGANAFLVVPAGGPPPEKGREAEVLVTDETLGRMLPEERDA